LISYTKIICLFICAAPIINNINGYTMREFNLSILGPVFYLAGFMFFCGLTLYKQKKIFPFLGLIVFVVHFAISVAMGYNNIRQIQYYIKFVFPFIIYLVLKYTVLNINFNKIQKGIIMSGWIYIFFIFFSFLIGFKYYEGKGYYGFIHALNDLIIFLLFLLPVVFLRFNWQKKLIYFCGIFMTFSKALIVTIPYYLVFEMLSKSNRKIINKFFMVIFCVFMIVLLGKTTIPYYGRIAKSIDVNLFSKEVFFEKKDNYILYNFLLFGRYKWLNVFYKNHKDKSFFEKIWGSGFLGAEIITEGKGGIEMDPFDVYNIYGVFFLAVFVYFYYFKIVLIRGLKYQYKLLFLPAIGYSIFGGHLANNPISNIPVAILILLLERGILLDNSKCPQTNANV